MGQGRTLGVLRRALVPQAGLALAQEDRRRDCRYHLSETTAAHASNGDCCSVVYALSQLVALSWKVQTRNGTRRKNSLHQLSPDERTLGAGDLPEPEQQRV